MLQNREVGGATMGAGRGRVEGDPGGTGVDGSGTPTGILYGPWGYVNFAAAVGMFAGFVWLVSSDLDDPLGGHWAWGSFLMVVSLSTLGVVTRRFGAASLRRHAQGPRDARHRIQQIAPFVVLGLLLIGMIGHFFGADELTTVMIALAVGATAGLAPTFLLKPAGSPDRMDDPAAR